MNCNNYEIYAADWIFQANALAHAEFKLGSVPPDHHVADTAWLIFGSSHSRHETHLNI